MDLGCLIQDGVQNSIGMFPHLLLVFQTINIYSATYTVKYSLIAT